MKSGIPFKDRVIARSRKLGLPEPKFGIPDRKQRRRDLIDQVKRGLDMSGSALQELRDDEHWKDTGHTTFAAFCKDTFGISKTKLYTVLKGMEVITSLPPKLQPLITSDAQVLALAKLPKNRRARAISKAAKNGGLSAENISLHGAKKVSRTKTNPSPEKSRTRNSSASESEPVTEETPKSPTSTKDKKVELDKIGTPVPDDALPSWKRRKEVQALLRQISEVRTKMKQAKDSEDGLYIRVSQNAIDYLSRAYHVISDCLPYTLCTRCMGSPSLQPEGCSFCGSTGVISKLRWDHNADPQIKKIRMLSNADYAKDHNLAAPTESAEEVEAI